MAFTKKKQDTWRDEPASPGSFKCACGCALQLSKGDLADAIRLAIPFDGNPRTYGVTYTKLPAPRDISREAAEPAEKGECPKCGESMELPAFAAKMLAERKAEWPACSACRSGTKKQRHAREYWE